MSLILALCLTLAACSDESSVRSSHSELPPHVDDLRTLHLAITNYYDSEGCYPSIPNDASAALELALDVHGKGLNTQLRNFKYDNQPRHSPYSSTQVVVQFEDPNRRFLRFLFGDGGQMSVADPDFNQNYVGHFLSSDRFPIASADCLMKWESIRSDMSTDLLNSGNATVKDGRLTDCRSGNSDFYYEYNELRLARVVKYCDDGSEIVDAVKWNTDGAIYEINRIATLQRGHQPDTKNSSANSSTCP